MATPAAGNISGTITPNAYLTDYSVQYIADNRNYVAGAAASLIPVELQAAEYTVYDRGAFLRDEMEYRPLGGRPPQVGYSVSDDNYFAKEYSLEHPIDDRQRRKFPANRQINLDLNGTRLLTNKSLIKRDVTWAQKFFRPGVWSFDVTGVASAPEAGEFLQFDQDGSDPIGTVDSYIDITGKATGFRPNTLVLGTNVRKNLRTNADLSDRIKYTRIGIADEDLLQSIFFGNDPTGRVMTARSVYNAAAEGLPNDFRYIVDENSMWMGYIDRNVGVDSPTAIGIFAWSGLIPGAGNDQGGVIMKGREELAHSDILQIRDAWDMKVVASDLGVFFQNVVSG
ncbi:hypothetical protein DYI37_03145 [Fulvimarina endophytica]|uniref:Major capsid protein n=1 Tax=Fulvimarina endophytica TaxID=2293836 RepID=A0A371XBN0_9HYPH|nr:hypothetical protein [Fulvimarina endophytica]RFC66454.1 hypothetical protein DYI37_03145 [Fulvimarina endophytica]